MAATIDTLLPLIYHERQQEGSMLCAQHALNALLQDQYFSAPDLAEIAQRLDNLEQGYRQRDDVGTTSMNMDDTGFFSVQVMEEALKPMGLVLRRWRSEAMRPYQDQPHIQLAFILNSEQHWYTLRRFGDAFTDFTQDPGAGHWFNLDSLRERPQWIAKLMLEMTLQQAEAEGYSVFVVIQEDPDKPLALPRAEADHIAAFVPEDSRPSDLSSSSNPSAPASKQPVPAGLEGWEDEDMELQAALQASILGNVYHAPPSLEQTPPHISSAPSGSSGTASAAAPAPASRHAPRRVYLGSNTPTPPLAVDDDDDEDMIDDTDRPVIPPVIPQLQLPADLDPLAASRARSQAYMDHARRQQEAVLRGTRTDSAAELQARYEARRREQQAREEEEDEELRRAIEASRALHETQDSAQDHEVIDVDEEIDESGQDSIPHAAAAGWSSDRVYDDEDAELQAALKASLEDATSADIQIPDSPPPGRVPQPTLPTAPATSSAPIVSSGSKRQHEDDEDDLETESEADTSVAESEEPKLSMEEMRRKRLARFGG